MMRGSPGMGGSFCCVEFESSECPSPFCSEKVDHIIRKKSISKENGDRLSPVTTRFICLISLNVVQVVYSFVDRIFFLIKMADVILFK